MNDFGRKSQRLFSIDEAVWAKFPEDGQWYEAVIDDTRGHVKGTIRNGLPNGQNFAYLVRWPADQAIRKLAECYISKEHPSSAEPIGVPEADAAESDMPETDTADSVGTPAENEAGVTFVDVRPFSAPASSDRFFIPGTPQAYCKVWWYF